MLFTELCEIGNKLLVVRKRRGLTQAEVAEAAGLSDRTYADIERGTVNMRIETLLRICRALRITPNDILTEDSAPNPIRQDELLRKLDACDPGSKKTALELLNVYLHSVE